MGIARKSAIDAAGQVGVTILSMLAGIVLSQLAGAEGRGMYLLATSVANGILLDFTNLGLRLTGQVFVAREPSRLPEVHSVVAGLSFLVGLVVGVPLLLVHTALSSHPALQQRLFSSLHTPELLAITLTLGFQIYLVAWHGIMIGLGHVKQRALFEVAYQAVQSAAVLAIPLISLLALKGQFIGALVWAYYLIVVLGVLTMGLVLRHLVAGPIWRRPRRGLAREMLAYGRWVYIGNMARTLQYRVDQLITEKLGGAAALGVYGNAANLTFRYGMVATALCNAAYQPICAADLKESSRLVAASFRQLLLVGSGALLVGWIAAPLIPLIYGHDFAASVLPFRILLLGIVLNGASSVFPIYFSGRLQNPRIPMLLNWTLLPVQVGLCWYLGQTRGAVLGISVASCTTNVLSALGFLILFVSRRETCSLRELFTFYREDFRSWKRLLGR